MLLASTFASRSQRRVDASRAALARSIQRLEALARTVLPRREAEELLATCRCFRDSAADAERDVGSICQMVDSGDLAPREAEVLEREVRGLLQDLERLSVTAGELSALVVRRISSAA